ASGIAGGKRVLLDKVIWDIIPDAQTAASALMAGEVDFFELPPIDILPTLTSSPGIKTEVFSKLGNVGQVRLNHLHPPFNNLAARKAAQLAINQEDIQRAAIGNPNYYRTCGSHFTCGSAMGVEDGSDVLMLKAPMAERQAKARELLKQSGYDGKPIILLHATNIHIMNQTMLVVAQQLRQVGFNVEWAYAPNLEARKGVTSRLNKTMMDYVHDVKTGQWVQPAAYRGDRIRGLIQVPEVIPWWNVERYA
ncbi:MAG: hypothetical protein EB064_04045, partial [Betaproteobacteria bacterium]|nr:hypothetical protein [Betaproteobacteria bacterium]